MINLTQTPMLNGKAKEKFEEKITKEQQKAINRLNSALKNAHKNNIFLCGMDCDLLYATQQAINNCANDSDYCEVACFVISTETR